MTKKEKQNRIWNESGQPHLVWDSSKRGTYFSFDEEHKQLMEENCRPFRSNTYAKRKKAIRTFG